MDAEFKERFLQNWSRYFPGAELPIGFYYSNTAETKFMAKPPKGHRCIIGDLVKVRNGKTLCFDTHTIGCFGGKRYLGFERKLSPNFDEPQPNGVIAPFCAGCASIVDYPYKEFKSSEPRAVLGMFDVSARPCVPSTVLTFAVPWSKYVRMVNNMKESFLITKSWNKVRMRMKRIRNALNRSVKKKREDKSWLSLRSSISNL